MSQKEPFFQSNFWNIFLFILAVFFILLSFIVPVVLTESNRFYNFFYGDFHNDSVGGLMNPFIAIAGVIATFLAFFMQVRANKIQQEQFRRSLAKPFVEKKLKLYNYLSVIDQDIQFLKKDILQRIEEIDNFFSILDSNPYYNDRVKRTQMTYINKIVDYDRFAIIESFRLFMGEKYINIYNEYMNVLNFLKPSLVQFYEILDFHVNDVTDNLRIVQELLKKIKLFCDTTDDNNLSVYLKSFIKEYDNEVMESFENKRRSNFNKIKKEVEKYFLFLQTIKTTNRDEVRLFSLISDIIFSLTEIERGVLQIKNQKEEFINQHKSNVNKFQKIQDEIQKAISHKSEEGIIQNFMKL